MRRAWVRFGTMALGACLAGSAITNESRGDTVLAQGNRVASPTPGVSPGPARERDAATGADEVGIGRSTGAVKGSGDEGGTAAGMPGKAPAGH